MAFPGSDPSSRAWFRRFEFPESAVRRQSASSHGTLSRIAPMITPTML